MPVSRPLKTLCWATLLACVLTNTGCVLAVGGAAVGSALVATDRRSSGVQLEDVEIEHRVSKAMEPLFTRESVHVDVTVYDGEVLLSGEVPTDKDRKDAETQAAYQQNVRHVTNDLSIGSLSGFSNSANDILLATKVRAALLDVKGLPPGVVKVSVTFGKVYLFGQVSRQEADLAKDQAAHVSGVKRVMALFKVLTPDEFSRLTPPGK